MNLFQALNTLTLYLTNERFIVINKIFTVVLTVTTTPTQKPN